jgi:hypothetical protein
MTFPTNTIRLEAARFIFTGVEFSEIMVNDKRVGFKAVFILEPLKMLPCRCCASACGKQSGKPLAWINDR